MNKKKILLAIVIAVSVLLLMATSIFFLGTKGTIEEKDGLLQNSRIYITNIYCENESIYYTVVNKTFRSQPLAEKPYVQKRIDGKWEQVILARGSDAFSYSCDAFTEWERELVLVYPEKLTAGEYRLVFGDIHGTASKSQLYEFSPFVVGYFTVTAPAE